MFIDPSIPPPSSKDDDGGDTVLSHGTENAQRAHKEVAFRDHHFGVDPIPSFERLRAQEEARTLEFKLSADDTPKIRNNKRGSSNQYHRQRSETSGSTKSKGTTADRSSHTQSSKQAVVGDDYDGDVEDDDRRKNNRKTRRKSDLSSPVTHHDSDGIDDDHYQHPKHVNLNFKRSRSGGKPVPMMDMGVFGEERTHMTNSERQKLPCWLRGRFLVGLLIFATSVAVAAALGWQTERRGEALLRERAEEEAAEKNAGLSNGGYYYGEVESDTDYEADELSPYEWLQVGPSLHVVDAVDGNFARTSSLREPSHAWFGYDVSLSADGTVLAVGSPRSPNDNVAGSVRVYEHEEYLDPNTGGELERWVPMGSEIFGSSEIVSDPIDRFGYSVSLSPDGRAVAVGAVGANAGKGAVEVFTYDAFLREWERIGDEFGNDDGGGTAGYSVASVAKGNRVIVGIPGNGTVAGSVGIHERSRGGNWTRVGSSLSSDSAYFGKAVSASDDGTRIAVGSVGAADDHGDARVYRWSYDVNTGEADWVLTGGVVKGEKPGDRAGFSVSLSADGERLAVGAIGHDVGVGNRDVGKVTVHRLSNDSSEWVPHGKTIVGEKEGGKLGFAVELSASGKRVAVGGTNSVRVYEHSRSKDRWVQIGRDILGEKQGDFAGFSVALSATGDRVVVGAPMNDGNGVNGGQVRVFDCKERLS